jgi:hypoxanthine phosphoribosyltransferase
MRLSPDPLLTAEQVRRRVNELADRISEDNAGRSLMLIAVLKGGTIFAADLMRRLTIPVSLDFIRARSYQGTQSQGRVDFTFLPEQQVRDRHVLVVEDILDTGVTAAGILRRLEAEQPASLALCTLLDKPSRRTTGVHADYVGFTIGDHFVVGYGLDYEERGRELPDIYILQGDGAFSGDAVTGTSLT